MNWIAYQHLTLYIACIETTRQSSAGCYKYYAWANPTWKCAQPWCLNICLQMKTACAIFIYWNQLNSTSHMSECQLDFFFVTLANALDFSKSKAFSNRASHSIPCLNSVRICSCDEEYMIAFFARTILLFCTSWRTNLLFHWKQVSPFIVSFHRGAAAL